MGEDDGLVASQHPQGLQDAPEEPGAARVRRHDAGGDRRAGRARVGGRAGCRWPLGQACPQGPSGLVADPGQRGRWWPAAPERGRGDQAAQGPAQGDALPDCRPVEALADAIEPPYGVLVRVAAYTGLRPCEYVALRVGRLDLLRGTARVAEAAPEVAGHLEWGGVKTHEARTVRLPRSVAEELGAYLADRPHGSADLVFTAPRGGPVRSRSSSRSVSSRPSRLRTTPLPSWTRTADPICCPRSCGCTTCGTRPPR